LQYAAAQGITASLYQGAPIPPDLQKSTFDPFVNRDAASSAVAKRGLGLGLFIVKEIITGRGGMVELTSTESEGIIFTVRLPRVPGTDAIQSFPITEG